MYLFCHIVEKVLVVRDDNARQFRVGNMLGKTRRAACELEKGVFVLEKGVVAFDICYFVE